MDRVLKAIIASGTATVVLLAALLASGATGASPALRGTGSPVGTSAVTASAKPPVLPLPGQPGFPPKRDSPALTSQEMLPNFVSGFPGIPTSPDIVGYPPVHQVAINGSNRNLLVFNTAFFNHGSGPILVWGHRANNKIRDMTGDQYIRLKSGGYALRPDVGVLRYIFPTGLGLPHQHWHFVGAEVYAIYPQGHFDEFHRLISQKQGFCMSEPASVFTDYCGYRQPGENGQIEAMYAHTADFYDALVEGQDIDITGVPAGKYVLLNWVNSKCQVKETTYADDAASAGFTLSYPNGSAGVPSVTLGAELNGVPHPPCPTPGMTGAQARSYVRNAAVTRSGGAVSGLRSRCSRASATGFSCAVSWRRRGVPFTGKMTVSHVASTKLARYATALSGISAEATFSGKSSGQTSHWSLSMRLLPGVQPARLKS